MILRRVYSLVYLYTTYTMQLISLYVPIQIAPLIGLLYGYTVQDSERARMNERQDKLNCH